MFEMCAKHGSSSTMLQVKSESGQSIDKVAIKCVCMCERLSYLVEIPWLDIILRWAECAGRVGVSSNDNHKAEWMHIPIYICMYAKGQSDQEQIGSVYGDSFMIRFDILLPFVHPFYSVCRRARCRRSIFPFQPITFLRNFFFSFRILTSVIRRYFHILRTFYLRFRFTCCSVALIDDRTVGKWK